MEEAVPDHERPDDLPRIKVTVKMEDKDDMQREHRKFRNAKRAKHRQRTAGQHQPESGDLYDCSII